MHVCVCVCALPILLRRFFRAMTKAKISASTCWSPVSGIEEDGSVVVERALKRTYG